jgi:Arm DNA-binding domain
MTPQALRSLAERPSRTRLGPGLFFRSTGLGRAYFVYRFSVDGREREMSLGPYPELSLAEARAKHTELRKKVRFGGIDPLEERDAAKEARRARKADPAVQRAQIVEKHAEQRRKLTRAEAPGMTHLYRHYGFDGALLYVGVSNNVFNRWDSHKRKAAWADLVAIITVDHFPTREDAEEAEADAILAEKPRFNNVVLLNAKERRTMHNSRRKAWPAPPRSPDPMNKK